MWLQLLPQDASELLPIYNKTSLSKYLQSKQVADWSDSGHGLGGKMPTNGYHSNRVRRCWLSDSISTFLPANWCLVCLQNSTCCKSSTFLAGVISAWTSWPEIGFACRLSLDALWSVWLMRLCDQLLHLNAVSSRGAPTRRWPIDRAWQLADYRLIAGCCNLQRYKQVLL